MYRPRRLRRNDKIRNLVREIELSINDLVYPLFLVEGEGIKKEIPGLDGNYHFSVDMLEDEIKEIESLGINAVILFGVPDAKDEVGSSAFDDNGIVQRGIQKVKSITKDLLVITDVCLCQYTDHGHCGILNGEEIDNDLSLEYLSKVALSHAKAGADMVAPSDMMDGRVKSMRERLNDNGYKDVSIMCYSAKYASAFYGPFRVAAGSAPSFGDRRSYQMDYANSEEAIIEAELDLSEGADILMVKPALSYLDIIYRIKQEFNVPVAAYHVSGEYSMIKAAANAGLIDEKKAALEATTSIKRAGASIIITYYAKDIARWLKEA